MVKSLSTAAPTLLATLYQRLALAIVLAAMVYLDAAYAQESTPEVTPEITALITATSPSTPTTTASPTPSPTATATATTTPTWTAVVVTSVVTQPPIVITQPPVVVPQPVIVTQPPVIITQQVAVPVVPTSAPEIYNTSPNGTPSNRFGWQRYESIAFIAVVGSWQYRTAQNASSGAYHEAGAQGALFRFPFDGEGVRLGFRAQRNGGSFHLRVDGGTLDVFDSALVDGDRERSVITQEYFFESGYHVLDVFVSTLPEQGAVAVDFVEVFTGPPVPQATVDAPGGMREVIEVVLVSAPATRTPTPTPDLPSVMTIDIIIAYDLNANDEIDPVEGVRNVSIRAVDALSNALLASIRTDDSGFARMEVATTHDLQLVIPLLGETFTVRNRGEDSATSWTLLIPPANVPGLIP